MVFADLKGDGQLDPGDPSAVTNAQGQFTLAGLAAGSVTIRMVLLPGELQSTPLLHLTVTSGLDLTTTTLGVRPTVLPTAPTLTRRRQNPNHPGGCHQPGRTRRCRAAGQHLPRRHVEHPRRHRRRRGERTPRACGSSLWMQADPGKAWALSRWRPPRLLGDNDEIRFLPAAGYFGTAEIIYRAWNQKTGARRRDSDLGAPSATGGTTAFSSNQAVARSW